jgi:hypothetical protein
MKEKEKKTIQSYPKITTSSKGARKPKGRRGGKKEKEKRKERRRKGWRD